MTIKPELVKPEPDDDVRKLLEGDSRRTSTQHDDAVLRAARAYATEGTGAAGWWSRILTALRPTSGWATAAASIAAAGVALWMGWQVQQQGSQLAAMEKQRETLTATVADLQKQVEDLQRHEQALSGESEQASGPSASERPRNMQLASIVLSPGVTRGDADLAQIRVQGDSAAVRLKLDLATVAEYPTYHVELRTTSGKRVWISEALRARVIDEARTLIVDLPASTLPNARYELAVRSTADADDPTYYYFEVRRP